ASIADDYGVSVADLRSWNRLKSNHLRRGTRLKVRTGSVNGPAASRGTPATAAAPPDAGQPVSATETPAAGGGTAGDTRAIADIAAEGSLTDPASYGSNGGTPRKAAGSPTRASSPRIVVVR